MNWLSYVVSVVSPVGISLNTPHCIALHCIHNVVRLVFSCFVLEIN